MVATIGNLFAVCKHPTGVFLEDFLVVHRPYGGGEYAVFGHIGAWNQRTKQACVFVRKGRTDLNSVVKALSSAGATEINILSCCSTRQETSRAIVQVLMFAGQDPTTRLFEVGAYNHGK